ncbi:hypothetical protein CANARDRAFT_23100 [[Candida] arabinofermentans NRRL YB-2248]|uniref:NADP-dependent oxidoreductase domain-containing protein n=1 Tax=[Candida] arabinofermentans NRRL YB-2248 TaxID=983967 RepID=A0A1E4T1H6_9ASCO|nr:hypothetical protein CANARDRAFT_23100 [[Candida] arabinofermentans NRRL YB-2248]
MSIFKETKLLNTGASIPLVAYGTYFETDAEAKCKVGLKAALKDAGYIHIDTARHYGTEAAIGEVLKELFAEGVLKREDLFITTKVWPTSWDDVEGSLNGSLKDLGVDYVDLLLQHWPLCFTKDSKPVEGADHLDTYKQMMDIYRNGGGKVKAIGVSNYSNPYLERLLQLPDVVVPAVDQLEVHPLLSQVEVMNFCKEKGILVEAFSPFGGGGAPVLKIPAIVELADKYEVSPADICVNYHVQSGRIALPRSENAERIKKGYKNVKLTKEDIEKLDKIGTEHAKRYIKFLVEDDLGFSDYKKKSS